MILWLDNWLRRRRNKKIRVVLSLLHHHGEMRGLDIVKASNGVFRRVTVYVFLDTLVVDGYIIYRSIPFEFAGTFDVPAEELSAPPFCINLYSITQLGNIFLEQLGGKLSSYR